MWVAIAALWENFVIYGFLWFAARMGMPHHWLYTPDGEEGDVNAWVLADTRATMDLILSGKTKVEPDHE